MDDAPQITLVAAPWDKAARADLDAIPGVMAREAGEIERQVLAGVDQYLAVMDGGRRIGALIWGLESDPDGRALIVKALRCTASGADLTGEMLDRVIVLAKLAGAVRVRLWTGREGLRRKLERRGFASRYVMEMELADGL